VSGYLARTFSDADVLEAVSKRVLAKQLLQTVA
jgi:hypothetical protein